MPEEYALVAEPVTNDHDLSPTFDAQFRAQYCTCCKTNPDRCPTLTKLVAERVELEKAGQYAFGDCPNRKPHARAEGKLEPKAIYKHARPAIAKQRQARLQAEREALDYEPPWFARVTRVRPRPWQVKMEGKGAWAVVNRETGARHEETYGDQYKADYRAADLNREQLRPWHLTIVTGKEVFAVVNKRDGQKVAKTCADLKHAMQAEDDMNRRWQSENGYAPLS